MPTLKELGDIAKGFSTLLLKKLELTSEETNKLSTKRMNTCRECPFFTSLQVCQKCGCYMPAKVLNRNADCPEKYW